MTKFQKARCYNCSKEIESLRNKVEIIENRITPKDIDTDQVTDQVIDKVIDLVQSLKKEHCHKIITPQSPERGYLDACNDIVGLLKFMQNGKKNM